MVQDLIKSYKLIEPTLDSGEMIEWLSAVSYQRS